MVRDIREIKDKILHPNPKNGHFKKFPDPTGFMRSRPQEEIERICELKGIKYERPILEHVKVCQACEEPQKWTPEDL